MKSILSVAASQAMSSMIGCKPNANSSAWRCQKQTDFRSKERLDETSRLHKRHFRFRSRGWYGISHFRTGDFRPGKISDLAPGGGLATAAAAVDAGAAVTIASRNQMKLDAVAAN